MIEFGSKMDLVEILNRFVHEGVELYRSLSSNEVIERVLPHYFKAEELAELARGGKESSQARIVASMLGKEELSSISVMFHERCEVGGDRDLG